MEELKTTLHIKSPVDLRLQRIADVLLLNAGFTDNPGLLNGKMGIAVFLYRYSCETGIKSYENYAGELIDEIYEGISAQTPVDLANGLTGIGWGIEYIVKNGFVEADTDEALAEIDNAVHRTGLQQPVLLENSNDLFGYGFYYLARLWGKENDDDNLNTLVKKEHLIYLTDECERLLIHRRYLDFNILSMSIGTINSIAWFLLEMYKLGLFPTKVDKLLMHLPSELDFAFKTSDDPAGCYALWHLIQNIVPLIKDNEVQKKYMVHANMAADKWKSLYSDDENIISSFSSIAWQKLIYSPYFKEDMQLPQIAVKAFDIIDNEEYWSNRLDNLNKENIGLAGFAGLGLGLLDEKGLKVVEGG